MVCWNLFSRIRNRSLNNHQTYAHHFICPPKNPGSGCPRVGLRHEGFMWATPHSRGRPYPKAPIDIVMLRIVFFLLILIYFIKPVSMPRLAIDWLVLTRTPLCFARCWLTPSLQFLLRRLCHECASSPPINFRMTRLSY